MATEGRIIEPPPPERRADERRGSLRRQEDHEILQQERLRSAVAALMAVCGGLSVIFLFFAAMGAVDITDAVGATVAAVVLALIWIAGFVYRQRTQAVMLQRPDRERRGF